MNLPQADFEAFSQNAAAFIDAAAQLHDAGARIEPHQRDRLNSILNELTGLNYRQLQLADYKVRVVYEAVFVRCKIITFR